jgi:hypothetical protein
VNVVFDLIAWIRRRGPCRRLWRKRRWLGLLSRGQNLSFTLFLYTVRKRFVDKDFYTRNNILIDQLENSAYPASSLLTSIDQEPAGVELGPLGDPGSLAFTPLDGVEGTDVGAMPIGK